MIKSLKALERIEQEAGMPYFSTLYDINMGKEDFQEVRNALKRLEKLEKYLPEFLDNETLNQIYEREEEQTTSCEKPKCERCCGKDFIYSHVEEE